MNRMFKRTAFLQKHFCNNTNVFTVTFEQFNVSLLNRSIHFFLLYCRSVDASCAIVF